MSTRTGFSAYEPTALPPAIARYLDAQTQARGRVAIADVFDVEARVVDEGIEYRGIDAIRGWLANAASQYSYTTTFTGQRREGEHSWAVTARLEGDFPGGVADLRFDFVTADGRLLDLVIAPPTGDDE